MKENDSSSTFEPSQVAPTITLAKLYVTQNQLFDALAIYDFLIKNNPTDDLKNQRELLLDKIFAEGKLKYNEVIENLFTKEDLRHFQIVPSEKYDIYKCTIDLKEETKFPDELEIEEDFDSTITSEHESDSTEEFEYFDESSEVSEKETIKSSDETIMLGYEKFSILGILQYLDPNKKLMDLTVKDLIQALEKLNEDKKFE